MLNKKLYILTLIAAFFAGALVWYFKVYLWQSSVSSEETAIEPGSLISEDAVASVEGEEITIGDIDFEMELATRNVKVGTEMTAIPEIEKDAGNAQLRQQILSNLIERKVLYRMVQKDKDFDPSNPRRMKSCEELYVQWLEQVKEIIGNSGDGRSEKNKQVLRSRLCEQDVLRQYYEEIIVGHVKVEPAELRQYFEQNIEEFNEPERIVIRQILFAQEPQAKEVMRKLTTANFAEFAKTYSIAPEADKGGLLGPFSRTEFPATFEIAFSMAEKQISPIIKSGYGFHIFMVERKIPSQKPDFERVKPRIQKLLAEKKAEEEYQKWLEQALQKIKVDILSSHF